MKKLLFACIFMTFSSYAKAADKKIVMSCFENASSSPMAKYMELIYKEAFRRLGYDFEFKIVPAKRASIEANSGVTDGEPTRRYNFGKDYPNLIRIEEPVMNVPIAAFGVNPRLDVSGWEAIRTHNYKVDYLRGLTLLENAHIKPENLFELNSRTQVVSRLLSGRSDIYVDVEMEFPFLLKQFTADHKDRIMKLGVIDRIVVYGYLHRRHADLVPKVANVFRQMKEEGAFEQFKAIAWKQ